MVYFEAELKNDYIKLPKWNSVCNFLIYKNISDILNLIFKSKSLYL